MRNDRRARRIAPPSRPGGSRPPARAVAGPGTSDPTATASRRWSAFLATATSTTSAPRRAASSRRPTAACTGRRSSTTSRSPRSARSRSRRRIPTSCGPAPARPFIRSNISIGDGDLQVDRRRQDLDAHGPRADRPHRPHRHRSRESRRRFVAALGHAYGPQQERGVYPHERRRQDLGDGCCSSTRTPGASDVVMDPNNPRILFAGMWQLVIHTWGRDERRPGQRHLRRRATAARPGSGSPGHGLPGRARSARSASRSRRRESESRLRPDRNGGRRPSGGPDDGGAETWRAD